MKIYRLLFSSTVLLLIFAFFLFPASLHAQSPQKFVSGQILIKFKPNIAPSDSNSILNQVRGEVKEKITNLDIQVVKVPSGLEEKIASALSRNPFVEFAEPDFIAEALFTPNDTFFAVNQWGLENTGQNISGTVGTVDADIDASTAWDATQGGVLVAVLDTGIDNDHEDLSSKIILSKDFTNSPSGPNDFYGHGTHVAGIIGAVTNNGTGVAGSCPNCTLLNGKVLDDNGYGSYSGIANGMTWAANSGAKVINLSLGGPFRSSTLESAVNYAWNKGVVIVAAAGNSGNKSKTFPAAYTKAIAVAATNNQDQKASFSSYGSQWVDVAAPGENIFSTFPNHTFVIQTKYGRSQNYDFASGTSMAAPHAAGVSALIWSSSYGTSNSSVRNRLEATTDKISGTGSYWSKGRINAGKALQ